MAVTAVIEAEPLRAPPQNPLLVSPILGTITRLALPNTVAMLAVALVAIAETTYVGLLGTNSLAAMALVFPMVMLQQMMSAGAMGGGVSSAIARALGAGDEVRAAALALHAVVIGVSAAIVFSVLFLLFGRPLYQLLGGRAEVLQQAMIYSNTIFVGCTAIWLTNTLASVLRGSGNMKIPALALLGVALSQVVLGGTLGLGLGPVPRLGMVGIGLGQILAFSGERCSSSAFLRSRHSRVRIAFAPGSIRREMFRDILKVGAIASLSPLQSVLTVLILTGLIARYGKFALAGYGIGARLEFLLIPISFAIGAACVPLVGMAIGAGDVARARSVAWTGATISAVFFGIAGLVFAAAPWLWAGLFTGHPDVLASTYTYLSWAGPF